LRFNWIKRDIWSIRVTIGYRALGHRTSNDEIVWYWIGGHADYDKLLPWTPLPSGSGGLISRSRIYAKLPFDGWTA
jgi:hypothetical protein